MVNNWTLLNWPEKVYKWELGNTIAAPPKCNQIMSQAQHNQHNQGLYLRYFGFIFVKSAEDVKHHPCSFIISFIYVSDPIKFAQSLTIAFYTVQGSARSSWFPYSSSSMPIVWQH